MRIAIPYDNGNVGQHFGHSEQFKIYDIAEGEVYNSQVLSTNGAGHESIVDFLFENAVSGVICGGIGEGAIMALQMSGIMPFAGITGNADEVMESFLAGTLEWDQSYTCHEHDEGGEGCGHSCGGCHGCH